jgi:hypothetical protein
MNVGRIPWAIGAVLAIGLAIIGLLWIPNLLRQTPQELAVLDGPAAGEARPDYLADGTPVWVMGHDDGTVSVLSGFDTHRPSNIRKLLWWCESADAFQNPEAGAKYDEYGTWIGGPALGGLPTYAVEVIDGRISVGEPRLGAPAGGDHTGPPEVDREWCREGGPGVAFHTFADWRTWDSPTAAVEAAPDGWILLAGRLALNTTGEVVLCATNGCDDSVRAASIEAPPPDLEFGPLFGDRFIAQVRDGALTAIARVLPHDP